MLRSSSSTFNSDRRPKRRAGRAQYRSTILVVMLWTLVALILIDAVVGRVFRMPADPRQTPSPLQAYFNYGRSIEGKLRFEVGAGAAQDTPVIDAGWLPGDCDVPSRFAHDKLSVDVYGMSFSNQIADQMALLDSGLAIQNYGGPGAPLSHSYACFTRRISANVPIAPVQIVGVLASSVIRMHTISGLTTSFEGPQPFTYPRYSLEPGGQLKGFFPSIQTRADLSRALNNPPEWQAFLSELASHDAFYAPVIVQSDLLDYSVLGRIVRRALGQRWVRDRTAALLGAGDFAGAPDIPPLLRALLVDFAEKARAKGARPIVILIEDRGYGGVLSTMLVPALDAKRVEFLATSAVASSDDSANFLADGHFKTAINAAIARRLLDVLRGPGVTGAPWTLGGPQARTTDVRPSGQSAAPCRPGTC
jgi:hypothetical protein